MQIIDYRFTSNNIVSKYSIIDLMYPLVSYVNRQIDMTIYVQYYIICHLSYIL